MKGVGKMEEDLMNFHVFLCLIASIILCLLCWKNSGLSADQILHVQVHWLSLKRELKIFSRAQTFYFTFYKKKTAANICVNLVNFFTVLNFRK